MISFAQSLPIGNAVKIVIAPGAGAVCWRVLRKATDDIANESDPLAKLIYEGRDVLVVDALQLANGTEYFYKEFEYNGTAWAAAGDSVGLTPVTDYNFAGADVLTLVRDRLKAGIAAAVANSVLKPDGGVIEVFTAPPLWENIKWPIVSVHLAQDASEVRGIGETLAVDQVDHESGKWLESEGWLSRVRLQIIGWSTNSDVRILLRKVIKSIIQGNLEVFDAAGMVQIDFSQTDVEDFGSYNAPVYQVVGDFSCLAPSVVQDEAQDSVIDVTVDVEGI
jgi:hypothetical protein